MTLAGEGEVIAGESGGRLVGRPPKASLPGRGAARPAGRLGERPESQPEARPLGIDQSHTSVVLDEARVLKLYRRMVPGVNPEVELAVALAGVPGAPVPAFGGAIRFVPAAGGASADVAIVQRFVPGAVDEFESLADQLAAWLLAGASHQARAVLLADAAPAGRALAGLHAALRQLTGRGLAPRLATPTDRAAWRRRADRAVPAALRKLRRLDPDLAAELAARRPAMERALAPLAGSSPSAAVTLTGIHGDLHLGQLIRDGAAFLVVDLEGEPTTTCISTRRRRSRPCRPGSPMPT